MCEAPGKVFNRRIEICEQDKEGIEGIEEGMTKIYSEEVERVSTNLLRKSPSNESLDRNETRRNCKRE